MVFRRKGKRENMSVEEVLCSRIEPVRIWKSISCILLVMLFCTTFAKEVRRYLTEEQGHEFIEYQEFQSKLADIDSCFLCGDHAQSMIGYYRQFDTIGLISLNDWYMTGFSLLSGSGNTLGKLDSGTSLGQVNTGLVSILTDSLSSGRRAAMQVTWEDGLTLDTTLIQEKLCQVCLSKVTDSLVISKRRYEKKTPIPFCLVDFQTLELYSLQDWSTEYCIRDYWVDLRFFDDGMSIKAYSSAQA